MTPWMEFISSLAGSLSWPIVVLVAMVVFHPHIGRLINKVGSIRIGDKQINFTRELDATLDAALEQAEQASLPIKSSDALEQIVSDRAQRSMQKAKESIEDSPRAAIIEAWLSVERALSDACERLDLAQSYGGVRTFRETSGLVQTSGHLDSDLLGLLHHLRHLRNEAAHAIQFDISSKVAAEYIRLCLDVVAYLQPLGQSD